MNVIIIGQGKILYFLSRAFLSKGYKVTVACRAGDECQALVRRLQITVIHGDGTDLGILEEAGARAADVVLAVTANDEDNLAACQMATLRFGVPRSVALVNDPDNEEVFSLLGVEALSPTRIVATMLEQKTSFDDISQILPMGGGKVNVTEVALNDLSPVTGQSLAAIELPPNSLIACVMRRGVAIVPHGRTVLEHGDRVILITLPENHSEVLKTITGTSG